MEDGSHRRFKACIIKKKDVCLFAKGGENKEEVRPGVEDVKCRTPRRSDRPATRVFPTLHTIQDKSVDTLSHSMRSLFLYFHDLHCTVYIRIYCCQNSLHSDCSTEK